MTRSTIVFAIAMPIFVSAQASAAQHGHSSGPKPNTHAAAGPKTTSTTHGHAAAPAPVKTTGSHSTHVAKTTTHGNGHASVKTTGSGSSKVKSTTTTSTARNGKTGTVTTTGTLSPAQQKLQRNTNLARKLQSRLPAGTDLMAASAGFRNLGQFVAAVNVSKNLGIPFSELKTRMVTDQMSLGQAIQDARPRTTDTTTIVRRAESDADAMIRSTETATAKNKNKTVKKNGHQ
jgi:hypothetical protein